jgi:iron-sulfur cluster protein
MSRHYGRVIGDEIGRALADPILKEAMTRAMETMRERRAAVVPAAARFEELRTEARAVKARALDQQEGLLAEFAGKAAAAGAVVLYAHDAGEACAYVAGLARERGVTLATKSKSMTSEEIHLNAALERTGVTVVEGDLGERIIQLAGERPSHLVAPAIHKSREEVVRLLSEKMRIAQPPRDAEGLTKLVREDLRARFLTAGMGITGANFAVAETGSIVLVENEGNISLTSQLPPLHVAIVGREKIIPTLADLAVFLELLPCSATGQKMTSYVSVITGRQRSPVLGGGPASRGAGSRAADEREFHLLILDNGRSRALADAELREALMCIRCGACLNACAPYTLVGGHVYGGDPYPGGIGCVWTYITKGHSRARDFGGLCTTCSRCTEVCPVKIDIPWLNTVVRERNNKEFGAGLRQRVFARADLLGKALSPLAPFANRTLRTPAARSSLKLLGIDAARGLPAYERRTFLDWWKQRPTSSRRAPQTAPLGRVALFVDCFMNHNLPQVGRAAVEVLERAGIEVIIAHNACCGRPAMSQGLLGAPRRWAVENLIELGRLVDEGYEVVCIEPSCLSALRDDYRRLLERTAHADDARLDRLEHHAYEITEYLVMPSRAGRLSLEIGSLHESYVVHGHCHQKSLGIGSTPAELLRLIPGVTIHEVEALCCGMVGSFGYKKEYSLLSQAIGAQLFRRIAEHGGDVVACGISCRSQIAAATGRRVLHPVEVLARAMQRSEQPRPA